MDAWDLRQGRILAHLELLRKSERALVLEHAVNRRVGPWQCIGCEEVLVIKWIDIIKDLVEAGEGALFVVPREDQGRNVLLQDEELPLLWHLLEFLEEVFVRNGPADSFDLIN